MKSELETVAELQAMASWRVAVSQGLTLLGFKDWLMECANHSSDLRANGERDRLAGAASDEFVLVLTRDAGQHEAARCVASSIIADNRSALHEPEIDRALAGSLGIALFPNHAADADSLLLAADHQRYEAKHQGKGTIRFAQS